MTLSILACKASILEDAIKAEPAPPTIACCAVKSALADSISCNL